MPNEYFDPGEQRASKVKALFERIATRYDLLNDLQSFGLHRYWKRRVLELAQLRPGQRSLDLCCGTGDITLRLAQHGLEAVGLDFSEGMLRIAERRKAKFTAGNHDLRGNVPHLLVGPPRRGGQARAVSAKPPYLSEAIRGKEDKPSGSELNKSSRAEILNYIRGDAQRVPFLEASFDVVTIGYGLRNLTSWEAGLREMCRVAKPGARLIVLDFGKPDNPIWRTIYFGYLRLFVPLLGLIFCGSASAYAYILESLKHYPAQRGVADRMRDLGLVNVRIINLLGGAMSINYGEKKWGIGVVE